MATRSKAKAATNKTTTTEQNPDVAIIEMIKDLAELWDSTLPLDVAAMKLRCAGKFSEADESRARHDQLVYEACELEQRIARTDAHTPEGHAAKCKMVAGASFDPEDLIEIVWLLGYEAARLGLDGAMPQLLQPAYDAAA